MIVASGASSGVRFAIAALGFRSSAAHNRS
jgi:hypothetical protein